MKNRLVRSILALTLLAPAAAWPLVSVSINIAPPPLPLYAQPLVPGEGYIWIPGYWSWNPSDDDYYWVPGTWVLAPNTGQLWTPGYWAFEGAGYFWHAGYWGNQVGYYGGLNYGYGYTGTGYQGGRWDGSVFRYNAAASHVDPKVIHNVYNSRVVNSTTAARVSFSGSPASASARTPAASARSPAASARTPAASQRQPAVAAVAGPTAEQVQHEHTAMTTPTQRAWVPHGPPQVAATPKPSAFTVPEVEHVRSQPAARAPQAARPAEPRPQAVQRPQPQAQRPAQAAPERPAAKAEQSRAEEPRKER